MIVDGFDWLTAPLKMPSVVASIVFESSNLLAVNSGSFVASLRSSSSFVGLLPPPVSSSPDSHSPLIFRIRAASNNFPNLSVSTATSPEYIKGI